MSALTFALLFSSFFICLGVHAAFCHLELFAKSRQKQAGAAIATASTLVSFAAVLWQRPGGVWSLFFTLSVPALWGHLYFHVFNMSETARRIRILVDLRKGKPVSPEPQENDLVAIRLERLLALGQIAEVDGHLAPRHSPLFYIARYMEAYENLLFPHRTPCS